MKIEKEVLSFLSYQNYNILEFNETGYLKKYPDKRINLTILTSEGKIIGGKI